MHTAKTIHPVIMAHENTPEAKDVMSTKRTFTKFSSKLVHGQTSNFCCLLFTQFSEIQYVLNLYGIGISLILVM